MKLNNTFPGDAGELKGFVAVASMAASVAGDLKGTAMKTMEREEYALYRVHLKRGLRMAGYTVIPNQCATNTLESRFKLMAPVAIINRIEAVFEMAAKAWIDGNNSGDATKLEEKTVECERLRNVGERLLAMFDVTCDYPGLYPTFQFDGGDHYSVESVMRYVFAKRGQAVVNSVNS